MPYSLVRMVAGLSLGMWLLSLTLVASTEFGSTPILGWEFLLVASLMAPMSVVDGGLQALPVVLAFITAWLVPGLGVRYLFWPGGRAHVATLVVSLAGLVCIALMSQTPWTLFLSQPPGVLVWYAAAGLLELLLVAKVWSARYDWR